MSTSGIRLQKGRTAKKCSIEIHQAEVLYSTDREGGPRCLPTNDLRPSGNEATKQPGHPFCIKVAIDSSSLKPANHHAQSSGPESHDCMCRWRQPTRCPTTFSSSLLFFTLLLQSRPNTPPRVISSQILVRRVSPGSSSCSSFETLSRSKRREVPILRGFRRSPSCNVRAKRHFNF